MPEPVERLLASAAGAWASVLNRTMVAAHATDGARALRIDQGYVIMRALQNWAGHDYLKVDTYVESSRPVPVTVEIWDTATDGYWNRVNYNTVAPPGAGTLVLAAGQFVRILVEATLRRRHSHPFQHVDCDGMSLVRGNLLMQQDRLSDLVPHRVYRRERGHRLLENHAHEPAAHAVQAFVLLAEGGDVDVAGPGGMQDDLAPDDAAGALDQSEERVVRHRLAATRLAHERQGLPAFDGKADSVHGPQHSFVGKEVGPQIGYLEDRVEGGRSGDGRWHGRKRRNGRQQRRAPDGDWRVS